MEAALDNDPNNQGTAYGEGPAELTDHGDRSRSALPALPDRSAERFQEGSDQYGKYRL